MTRSARSHRFVLTALLVCVLAGCTATSSPGSPENQTAATLAPLDGDRLQQILGLPASIDADTYKFSVPRNELEVSVDGFDIIPPMGLTSWVVFAPAPAGTVAMGDLVLAEDEIGPAQEALIASGLTITALHNHFVRAQPPVMFMHIHGEGPAEELAAGVRATLDAISNARARNGTPPRARSVTSTFDLQSIATVLEHEGRMDSGVYKVTIGRPDVTLTDSGTIVTTSMGFNTWMAFQGTGERAAVSGDFAMLANEVAPVVNALVAAGIEVVAVHNHMIGENPRIFFLHFWGVGSVEKLAAALKAGLDRTAH